MGKDSRNGCGWECCPSGFVEHVKNYRYSRWAYGVGFFEYWWWEVKSLIGLNRLSKAELEEIAEEEAEDDRRMAKLASERKTSKKASPTNQLK
jgi:hypothetical protein